MNNRKPGLGWVLAFILVTCGPSGLVLLALHKARGRLLSIDIIIGAAMVAIGSVFFVWSTLLVKRKKAS